METVAFSDLAGSGDYYHYVQGTNAQATNPRVHSVLLVRIVACQN